MYPTLKIDVISFIHILQNSAHLSLKNSKLPYVLTVHTESFLKLFYFSANLIGDIIKKLDPNKAHEDDMISIHMLKLC